MNTKKILFIEICNYSDYPIGGYLSFAKQMLKSFGNQLALVGMETEENTPIGIWTKKKIDGVEYDYFAIRRARKDSSKKIIPKRLLTFFAIHRYRKEILTYPTNNIFIQTPEVLLSLKIGAKHNLCCRIPGLENPLKISRYSYSKYFASIFEIKYFKALKKAKIVLATGDNNAVREYIERSNGRLDPKKIIKFPSRINTAIFKPVTMNKVREILNWDQSLIYVSTAGRISKLKGWEFMLNCFIEFKKYVPNSHFVFIGDGEEKSKLEDKIIQSQLNKNVTITGRLSHAELANCLNGSNLYVMGSYVEGWSTALAEAISCGKPAVCTDFSSANELIDDGLNGFVIKNRNKDDFVSAMLASLKLPMGMLESKAKSMNQYSTKNLKNEIFKYWDLN